jgi:CrcB protein
VDAAGAPVSRTYLTEAVQRVVWICFAGAIGTGVRYAVNQWAMRMLGPSFHFGTLLVNVVGCFSMAFVAEIAAASATISPTLRLALTTGLLGGLTTYSSFNFETTRMFQDGAPRAAALNFALMTGSCFAAGLLGWALAGKIVNR